VGSSPLQTPVDLTEVWLIGSSQLHTPVVLTPVWFIGQTPVSRPTSWRTLAHRRATAACATSATKRSGSFVRTSRTCTFRRRPRVLCAAKFSAPSTKCSDTNIAVVRTERKIWSGIWSCWITVDCLFINSSSFIKCRRRVPRPLRHRLNPFKLKFKCVCWFLICNQIKL